MSIGEKNKQHKQQKPVLGLYIFTQNLLEKLSIFWLTRSILDIIISLKNEID